MAVFSQYPPMRTRLAQLVTRPVENIATTSTPHPIPPPPSSSASSSSPVAPEPPLPAQSFLPSESRAPELPRLSLSQSPPRPQAPSSPRPDDFYATQAPLSFISPPLSPSSPSSMGVEDPTGQSQKAVDGKEEETDPASFSLSQHNLPLSSFDVDAMREEEDQEDRKKAAAPLSQALHDENDDGSSEVELMTDPSPPVVDFMTQGPMLSEDQSQEPSANSPSASQFRSLDLSAPPPSYPSSMPPLSPGTPSPESSPPRRRHLSPLRSLDEPPPRPQPPVEVKSERGEEAGPEEIKDAGVDLFSAESIQQRQQRQNQLLLSEKRRQQGGAGQKRMTTSDPQMAEIEEAQRRVSGGQQKRQRMVRFSDERKVEEVREDRDERGSRGEGFELVGRQSGGCGATAWGASCDV